MQNRDAARYARWAAVAAGAIALIVAGVYANRKIGEARARRGEPAAVPASVKQSSAEFAYSKVDQNHTVFTIRASHATEFRDQNRALLEDVWITIYGQNGDRNDNIHTRECSYEPKSGAVRCEGEVDIDLESAPTPGAQSAKLGPRGMASDATPLSVSAGALQIKTSDLTFNRETGLASTSQPVQFTLPDGQGHAVGVSYNSNSAVVRLEHDVELDMQPSERTGGLPVRATGSSLEIRRNDRVVTLAGPARIQQGGRELTAEAIVIELDAQFHARHATATGHPVLRSGESGASFTATAQQFEGFLSAEGWVESVLGEGGVQGTRTSAQGSDHFSAAQVEFIMRPKENLIQTMTAGGGVKLDSEDAGGTRRLTAEVLRVAFAEAGMVKKSGQGSSRAKAASAAKSSAPPTATAADQQRIENAETLGPATIEMRTGDDSTKLHAGKFVARFGADGRFEKLTGLSGAEISRQAGKGAAQTSAAAQLTAAFDRGGEWATLDESGNVRFQQGDRRATAAHAHVDRAADTIELDGSPVLMDAESRTTAAMVTIGQKSGAIRATGGVVSTYLAPAKGGAMNLGAGAAHISADALQGSTTSGHVIYTGRARLWQGESVLDADAIEIWRAEKKLQATGHVIAVFPQAAGRAILPGGPPATSGQDGGRSASAGAPAGESSSGPTLWQIRAPLLTYWDTQGKAHLEGGVSAASVQGTLQSQSLDVFLGSAPGAAAAGGAGGGKTTSSGAAGGRQLIRALALGGVVVSQGDRRGTAEQAEYTASDEKFVLSGGAPTITDASRDTTTGRSLTFFVANDTILIDSQEGSRTLTKHRVEK